MYRRKNEILAGEGESGERSGESGRARVRERWQEGKVKEGEGKVGWRGKAERGGGEGGASQVSEA